MPESDDVGSWSGAFDWPIIGLHIVLTPDGKILTFGTDQTGMQTGLHIYDVWDPITDTHTTLEHHTNSDIFCAAALIVPSTGQILIMGGDARTTGQINAGIPDVNIYDPGDQGLTSSPTGPMEFSRWYGTAVGLGNGQIVMIGGRNDQYNTEEQPDFANSPYPEIYTEGYGFRTLTGAYIDGYNEYALYPRSFLTSKGDIWTFAATEDLKIYSIDPSGSGSVEVFDELLPRFFGDTRPAVMFDHDRVLLIANDGSAWVMDMSGDTPTFERTADVGEGRAWSSLTVLPDGRVMISGGSAVANELVGVNNMVQIWDPDTGLWTEEIEAAIPRLYHQATILLADGTVLSLGGGAPGPLTNLNGEIYSPDYLFDEGGVLAPRPTITEAPAGPLVVGDEFTIEVTSSAEIETLALMQFGSATHALNMASRRLELQFEVMPNGSLKVDLPDNANVLVPGFWMLFAIDANGTPSIAATVKIDSELAPFMPAVEHLDLGVSLERNGDAAYDGFDDSYVLAPDALQKEGSYFSEERVDLSESFEITFEIKVGSDDAGADGLAFVLHNDPLGPDAIGSGGGGLGASGIENGLAIEFDTYQNEGNPDEIANDHTNFFDTDSDLLLSQIDDLGNIENGQWHSIQVTWDGTSLSYSFDGIHVATLTADIVVDFLGGSQFAYFGFTGATGGETEEVKVRVSKLKGKLEDGHQLHADRGELPDKATFTLNGDAAFNAGESKFVLTPDAAQKRGSVMSNERIDLSQDFHLTFQINLGDVDEEGADGLAVVLFNDPRGAEALGGVGGNLGAIGIAEGIAIEFDTYQNDPDDPDELANDHTSFLSLVGENPLSPVIDLGNIEDGNWHEVELAWDGVTLSYWVDGTLRGTIAANVLAAQLDGSQFAHFGFTGATGGESQSSQVRILSLVATAEDGRSLKIRGPNTLPVAADDSFTMGRNGTVTVHAVTGVLANDTDSDGDLLTAQLEDELAHHGSMYPSHGTLTLNADGSFAYTPDPGFVGVDHFHYHASDGNGRTDARVTINVVDSLTVAQYLALPGVLDGVALLADTGANIATLPPGQVAGLATKGLDGIDATDNVLTLSVSQYAALGVGLAGADMVTLADSGANLGTLTPAQIGQLAVKGVDAIDATDNAFSLSLAQYAALGATVVSGTDVLTINGTDGDDTVQGRAGADILNGGAGADTLGGLAGADVVRGQGGNDLLAGGADGDSFVFNTALDKKSNVDTIIDFVVAEDMIFLDNAVFGKLKTDGALKNKYFEVGKKADDGNDYIVYNKKTGELFYDKNGDHKGGAVKFAVLQGSPDDLSKADFLVI